MDKNLIDFFVEKVRNNIANEEEISVRLKTDGCNLMYSIIPYDVEYKGHNIKVLGCNGEDITISKSDCFEYDELDDMFTFQSKEYECNIVII